MLFFVLIFFSGFYSVYSAPVDCDNINTTCVYLANEEEYGTKNYILAIYYGIIAAFFVFVWFMVKNHKPKGKIWESPENFFFGYTKFICWLWLILVLLYSQRLLFASHTVDYFQQVWSWWDTWFWITSFPYMFFIIYFVYRKIISMPSFRSVIRDMKEWWK